MYVRKSRNLADLPAVKLINLQFNVFTRFYALLRAFQGYTVFKFYPLSLRYRDPAASPLNARQYMFEN